MLAELTIRNFAVIDALKVAFSPGLNILTGETGAGKSIIIGAVSLILGDRASADMIRSDEDAATVEALFALDRRPEIAARLEEWGFGPADELVIKRTLSRSGKNRIHINGNLATLAMLSELAEGLINICGQHEHQVLLKEDNHVDLLDAFGRHLPLREIYTAAYDAVQALTERKRALTAKRSQREERRDYLAFCIDEINAVSPQVEEDKRLAEERLVLANARKLSELAEAAHDLLYGGEGAVLERLAAVLSAAAEIRRIDSRLVLPEEMEATRYTLEDAASALRAYAQGISVDPQRLEAVDERLEALGKLKRKYSADLDGVLAKCAGMVEELAALQTVDEELDTLEGRLVTALADLEAKGAALTAARRTAAVALRQAIEAEVAGLRMPGARFEVAFREPATEKGEERFARNGMDCLAFHFSANPGEGLKPLSRVASGGELSRVVLAMKKALAKADSVATIVFDEVDSGIGGATAEVVGDKIREVAGHHQVICITHLPQIACFGDTHFRVTKSTAGERTVTRIEQLAAEQRREEIARMLAGVDVTDVSRQHAAQMLAAAQEKPSEGRPC